VRWGISAAPIPPQLPFAAEITAACAALPGGFPPCFLYAIKLNETSLSDDAAEMQIGTVPGTDHLADGSNAGHGIFQLTSSWPSNWADPRANADYALRHYLLPAIAFFRDQIPTLVGSDLIRCAAAAYNAGEGGAWQGHVERGDVDAFDTDHYGVRALTHFAWLLRGAVGDPP